MTSSSRYIRRISGRVRVRCANRVLSDAFASKSEKKLNLAERKIPLRAMRNECKPECTTCSLHDSIPSRVPVVASAERRRRPRKGIKHRRSNPLIGDITSASPPGKRTSSFIDTRKRMIIDRGKSCNFLNNY
ncbi:hypothetical protein PUN28_002812 [Cardiocondyla obscurior]|uniref:Uncharacterized protein n=1 Tax=Cardiocondyla obscurior TaxID=286306 RepID=A0AAW2GW57_9HYME